MAKKDVKTLTPPPDDLVLQHEKFIEAYLSCFNGTMAYKIAYPNVTDDNVAAASASRLLRNVKIKAELERRFKEATMGKFEVLERLKAVANATLLPFVRVEDDGTVYFNFSDPQAKRHFYLIKKIKSRKNETINSKSGDVSTDQWIEVELHDALKALELIGKYHALFTEKVVQTDRKIIKVTIKKEDDDG